MQSLNNAENIALVPSHKRTNSVCVVENESRKDPDKIKQVIVGDRLAASRQLALPKSAQLAEEVHRGSSAPSKAEKISWPADCSLPRWLEKTVAIGFLQHQSTSSSLLLFPPAL